MSNKLENHGISKNGTAISKLRTFESFKIPPYRIYYGSMAASWFTQSMQMIARTLLLYRITESAFIIGVMSLGQAIPALLISAFGGAVADRLSKKYILVFCRAFSCFTTLGIALCLVTGYISAEHPESWWILFAAAVMDGIAGGFMQPANMSIIPELVGENNVMNAISLSSMGQNIFRLIGPLLAGIIIDNYSFTALFFLMTGMNAIAAISIAFMPYIRKTVQKAGSAFGDMFDGLRYLRAEPLILILVLFTVCHAVAGSPYMQLMPVFTEEILKVGATELGVLTAVSGVGALLISLLIASIPNKKRGLILISSGFLLGIPLIVFSFSRWWYLSLLMMPFLGMSTTVHSTMTTTIVQTYVPHDYRGRMQGLISMSLGLASLGTFMAGTLTEMIGVQWAVGSLAIFLTGFSLILLTFFPRLRKLN